MRLQRTPDPLPLHASRLRLLVLRQDTFRPAHGEARASRHPDGWRFPAIQGQRTLRKGAVCLHVVLRLHAEQSVPLSLSEVRLRLHGYEQGGRSSAATREIGQHSRRRFPKVHAQSTMRECPVPAFGQTDSLPLSSVSVRCAGFGADVRAQVSTHGHITTFVWNFGHSSEKDNCPVSGRHSLGESWPNDVATEGQE